MGIKPEKGMLHTFLGSCSYTAQWRPLRSEAHSSAVHQGHGIAMERQVCSPISRALVNCRGIEPCPYFTDWNDTFIFFVTCSPHSTVFLSYRFPCTQLLFCLTISSHRRVYQHKHIYVATYIYTHTQRGENQSDQWPFYYSTASCFTNMVSLKRDVIKDLFFQLCIVCHLCSGTVFSLVLGFHYFGLNSTFVLGGGRTNTRNPIFLVAIRFIKTHDIQLLGLCVALFWGWMWSIRLSESCLSTPSPATLRAACMDHLMLSLDPKACCSHWQVIWHWIHRTIKWFRWERSLKVI